MREAMPVMKFMIDGLNSFSKWCDRNGDNIVRFLKVTAAVLTTIFLPSLLKIGAAMLANPLTWIILALGALIVVIDDLVVYMQGGESALGGFWSKFGTGEEIAAALNKALAAVTAVLKALWKPLAVVAAGFAAFKTAGVMVQGFISVISSLRKAMMLLAANPLMVMLVGLVSAIMWVKDAFDRAGGDWSKVLGIMGQDVIDFLNIFGGLGDKIANSLGAFAEPIKALGNVLINIFKVVTDGAKLLWAFLTGESDEAKEKLLGAFKDSLGGLLGSIGNLLRSVLDAVLAGISALIDNFPEIAKAVLSALGNVLSFLAGVAVDALSYLASALDDLITYIAEKLGIAWAWDAVKEYAQALFEKVSAIFNGLVDFISTVVPAIPDYFADAWERVTSIVSRAIAFISGIIEGIYELVVSFFDRVSGIVSRAFALITGIFEGIYELVVSVFDRVSDIVSRAIALISGMLSGVYEIALSVFEDVANTVSDAFEAVRSTVSGAIDYVSGLFSNLADSASAVVSTVESVFTNAFSAISSFISTQWAAITQGASDFVNQVVSFISSLPSTIADIFSQFVTIVSGAFSSAWQSALEFFNSIFEFLAAIPQKLLEAFDISALIGKAKDALGGLLGGAVDSVSSLFGFGGDDEEEKSAGTPTGSHGQTANASGMEAGSTPEAGTQTPAASGASLSSNGLLAQTQDALNQQAILREQMPANANSTAYTTNNNQSASNEVTQNITINAGAGTDPRALRNAVTQGVSDANSNTSLVSTSDTGTMSI